MNCPTRVDPEALGNGWNQNPDHLAADTNGDNSGLANRRARRDHKLRAADDHEEAAADHICRITSFNEAALRHGSGGGGGGGGGEGGGAGRAGWRVGQVTEREKQKALGKDDTTTATTTTTMIVNMQDGEMSCGSAAGGGGGGGGSGDGDKGQEKRLNLVKKLGNVIVKFGKFVGPGFMISVAYIDPGNYATDVSAGAAYEYKLLVMVLASNVIAIFLQTLCIKLGSATGLNLAQNIKAHCPSWLNYVLWFFAEAAIIATDMAEVIGTAIALNLLLNIPIVAGCAISIVDVLIILIFYRPGGSMRGLRAFEYFVAALVLGVVVCFCIELGLIHVPDVGLIFKGYLPSSTLVEGGGLYQACGILGATVMPHSLYLGSDIVRPRLLEYDREHGLAPTDDKLSTTTAAPLSLSSSRLVRIARRRRSRHPAGEPRAPRHHHDDDEEEGGVDNDDDDDNGKPDGHYRPSIRAIKWCMSYSVAELTICLFTFALFVNSAILIVAGASLTTLPGAANATLFQIHELLSQTISPAAGVIFALALLLSGTSAGIICTMAGQVVAEGQLTWHIKPWMRRLMTRSISITPSIIIAGAVGKQGLSTALEASQVALSIILPFTSAPLIYFTCRAKFMTVVEQKKKEPLSLQGGITGNSTGASAAADDDDKGSGGGLLVQPEQQMVPAAPPYTADEQKVAPEPLSTSSSSSSPAQGAAVASNADAEAGADGAPAAAWGTETESYSMRNHWITAVFAVLMWLIIVIMNVAALVFLGLGEG